MAKKDSLVLQHNRIISYLQILTGICVAIWAGQVFKLFEIKSDILGLIIINNFAIAIMVGLIGWYYLRRKLKTIEITIIPAKG